MKGLPEERARTLAMYIIENNATVRQTAKKFNVSKSTVHKDVTKMKDSNYAAEIALYSQVKEVLEQNKAERHLRGGAATKAKYDRIRKK